MHPYMLVHLDTGIVWKVDQWKYDPRVFALSGLLGVGVGAL